MSIRRLSDKLKYCGFAACILGVLMSIGYMIAPPLPLNYGGTATIWIDASYLFIFLGLLSLFCYFCFYEVAAGYVIVDRRGNLEKEGWHFGLPPMSPTSVVISQQHLEIPNKDQLITLETPDNGTLGVAVTVSYRPDVANPLGLQTLGTSEALNKAIDNRVRGALNGWIMSKPLPGTLKRALSMQKEAETFMLGKLCGVSTELMLPVEDSSLFLDSSYPIRALGIRIDEINIVVWRPLEPGTGKPDWGDGDHTKFNAQEVFKQFHTHTDSLSTLRKLKEALLERYPDEAEDIEDIYDNVRISMKENRD